jgi:hypothetical protein
MPDGNLSQHKLRRYSKPSVCYRWQKRVAAYEGELSKTGSREAARFLFKFSPQVGFEPTTLRLRFIQSFRSGADYLINFLNCEKVAGCWWDFIGQSPQSLVSARSCLPFDLSASFAQDYHAKYY